MKNLLVAQSGGPSAAINATITGVIDAGIESGRVGHVYGALNGIKGVLNENFVNLDEVCDTKEKRDLLAITPAAAIGSCRWKLGNPKENAEEFEEIIRILRKNDIGYFIYTGGNDSMDTVYKLSVYCEEHNIDDIKVMGAPKTIDNDLGETDHCPGFGSAAKFIATAFTEIACDCFVYDVPSVTIVEVMGRNAGWLTAASALARIEGRKVPQLIYLCEKAFDEDQFIKDVNEALKKENNIIIAVSEGVKTADGNYVGEETKSGKEDVFGHKYLSGVGKYLEGLVGEKIGCKVRSVELNILQRCAGYMLSETDIMESRNLGAFAAVSAIRGKSGKMSAVRRISDDPYQVEIVLSDLSKIANYEKKVPMEWINEEGNDIKDELTAIWNDAIDYYFKVDQDYLERFGYLYSYEGALKAVKEGAPEGFHLPTDAEWMMLERHLGMDAGELEGLENWRGHAGELLKTGEQGIGFNALYGGAAIYALSTIYNSRYVYKNEGAYFWSSDQIFVSDSLSNGIVRNISVYHSGIRRMTSRLISTTENIRPSYSVRLIKIK